MRHLRLAQVLEWVAAHHDAGGAGGDPSAACQRASRLFAAGQLIITCDPATNDVMCVEEIAP
jgi:hypothetical protein